MPQKMFADTIRIVKEGITFELEPAPEGGYVIRVADYPSCVTQGETIDEALTQAEDALYGCLSVDKDAGLTISHTLDAWLAWVARKYEQEDKNTSPPGAYQGA